jgi:hypothetical protein
MLATNGDSSFMPIELGDFAAGNFLPLVKTIDWNQAAPFIKCLSAMTALCQRF